MLRRLGQIDAAVERCLARPLPGRARRVRDILRLGAAQILFLGTPPHAAVDSAVRLAARSGPLKGLVNAVLRRLAREGAAIVAGGDAATLNTPRWLWESWTAAYGEPAARAIAAAHLEEPPLDLTAKGEPAAWAAPLGARLLPWGSLRRTGGGPVESLPGYQAGAWWVQDAAAALPARLLMSAVPGGVRGRRVLDLCAAPGGKAAQLAAAGAEVTALDISPARIERLRTNLDRLRLSARTVVADARRYRAAPAFPAVLLDAPCSSTGTIRRHPDVARLKDPDDVRRMSGLQDQLLTAALAALRRVACWCSRCLAATRRVRGADRSVAVGGRRDAASADRGRGSRGPGRARDRRGRGPHPAVLARRIRWRGRLLYRPTAQAGVTGARRLARRGRS